VIDRRDLMCDGTIRLTLTAPAGSSMHLDLQLGNDTDGYRTLESATSSDGKPASVELRELNCFGDDSMDFVAQVSWQGQRRTGDSYRLERSGSF
jgi:hypothetical protein